ncbi:FAD-binding oxidoreductase, partial [Acinetobacter guillouiae]|uniref:FAD-binding oxidoreductase n=1 Tax=Acinetobacter guillouiae TaxID=106649 RepID=UPI002FDAC9D6
MIPRLNRSIKVDNLYISFASELRLRGFEGEISEGYADRVVQSTDNSIYQVLPALVIFPKNQNDLVRVARLAQLTEFLGIKLFPRGGGTGTNGQSLGNGVIVDISRHMNKILEINVEERWARVESGVVKDQLELALKPYGLFFAPELSTSNRATIGGMINTDASGQGSCVYGKTRNHVLELVSVLSDGSIWTSKPIDNDELQKITVQTNLVGKIHRLVDNIQNNDENLIKQYFPTLTRSLTGYDLAHIRDHNGKFDLNSILCGSEGTLAFISEAKLNLLPIPKFTALIIVSYSSFDYSLRDATRLMKFGATSIETIDKLVLELARKDTTWLSIKEFFPDSSITIEGVNLIEFTSDNENSLKELILKASEFLKNSTHLDCGVKGYSIAKGYENVEKIWSMRKRAVGLLGRLNNDKRPIPFVEDTAVPPENLADYILEFRAILDSYDLIYGMFGHVDAGVLHVRPAIDMKDPKQEKLIRLITDRVVALTQKYGGVLWGEHGKGFRSEYTPKIFGALYPRLQSIKATFDSNNQFNPGKIVAFEDHELSRLDEIETRGKRDRLIPLEIRNTFSDSLHCNGNGACFNFDPDDEMCPSWKVYRDRRFSPKGRASL